MKLSKNTVENGQRRFAKQLQRFDSGIDVDRITPPKESPKLVKAVFETRTAVAAVKLPFALSKSYAKAWVTPTSSPQEKPVVVLFPGYKTDAKVFFPLTKHLQNLGYEVDDWGLGTNLAGDNFPHKVDDISDAWGYAKTQPEKDYVGEGSVAYLCDMAAQQLQQKAKHYKRPAVLLGWSLGGYVAREVARMKPHLVNHVITMASPIVGGVKFTVFAPIYRSRGADLDWIERQASQRHEQTMPVPVTAIFTKSDGLVNWRATIDKVNKNTSHWEVSCAHCSMPFYEPCWRIIEQSLARHSDIRLSEPVAALV